MKRALAVASILALFVFPIYAEQKHSSPKRTAPVGEAWVAGWNSHDVEKVIPVFTDDVFYEDVTFGAANHGSAELRKFAGSFFDAVPDLKLELVSSVVAGGHGTIEWVLTGTDKGLFKTGKKFSVRGVSVIDVRGGKISRDQDFYDSGAIRRQVGVLPSQPSDPAK